MILKQFAYLVALAREKHFGRAAAASNISQPTLSAAIRNLEDELGAPIVERGYRFNGFTPEGLVVLDHAKRVLAECDALRQSFGEARKGLTGRLRLGVIPTALPVVSHLTAPFHIAHAKVTVTVLSMTSDEIARGIENFELEAGLTYLDNEPLTHVRAKPLYGEDYVFLTPETSPFADRTTITWAEAAQTPLCLLTPDMQNRRIIDGIFRSVGATPQATVETNSIFNLCSHASTGMWSSIVPRPLLHFFGVPQRTRPVTLVEPEASRTIGLVIADRDPPSPLARALFALAEPLDPLRVISPPKSAKPSKTRPS